MWIDVVSSTDELAAVSGSLSERVQYNASSYTTRSPHTKKKDEVETSLLGRLNVNVNGW